MHSTIDVGNLVCRIHYRESTSIHNRDNCGLEFNLCVVVL